jgi:hypothetical protein
MFWCMTRRWEGICESNPTTIPFEDWVQDIQDTKDLDVNKGKCLIRVFLSGLSGLWKNVLFMLKSMREKSRNDIL